MDNNNIYSKFIENKVLSKLYYTIYNDIVNYRVLTAEQLQQLELLTMHERLELLKTYNNALSALHESRLLE